MFTSFLILLLFALSAVAVNHWVLKENGRITQKIDSPFYMREPDNLVAFLKQIEYNDYVESSYLDLLRRREQIVEHLRFSLQFSEDLVSQAKCAMEMYLMEKRMSYLQFTPAYLKRLNLSHLKEMEGQHLSDEPLCQDVPDLSTDSCIYDNLKGLHNDAIEAAHIEEEKEVNIGEMGTAVDIIRRLAVEGLNQYPKSWKSHTISSYYWRMLGDARNALHCSRLGVMLAPNSFRDIPLLSLGTVLFRAGHLSDAVVVLTAAVEHAPNIPENHITLAAALAMKQDFNISLFHFDEAERLDPSLLPRTSPVRNFIACMDNLTKKTTKMYSYVEYMKSELKNFKKLKQQVSQNHDKLIQQQVPLSSRKFDMKAINEDLLKRGQYCSTRIFSTSEEPILFCDFYSDLQMRLESKDVDIESLEKDLKLTSEAVIKLVSKELSRKINFEQSKSAKAKKGVSATKKQKDRQ